MVLRLDPGIPLVWRSPDDIQLGIDVAVAVIEGVSSGQERLLAALAGGVSRSGYDMMARDAGVTREDAEALLEAIAPALLIPVENQPRRVSVLGSNAVATEIRTLLGSESLEDDPESAALVVLSSDWVLAPADHGTWLSRDLPHVPVIAGDRGVTVGPFVEPGTGPCLYCVHLARIDADRAWPAIASQLSSRPAPDVTRLQVVEVAAFAVRRIREWQPPTPVTYSWRVDAATGQVTPTEWRRHPGCLCAARPESDWAPASDPANPAGPTTAPAAAERA